MDRTNQSPQRISTPREVVLFLATITILGVALVLPGVLAGHGRIPTHPATTATVSQAALDPPALEFALRFPACETGWPEPEEEPSWVVLPSVSATLENAPSSVSTPPAEEASPRKAKPPFHGIITQVAGRYEVDPHLIRAIIFAESGFNPKARSKKGARGLMQLMPSTAKALGVQNIEDPAENIDGGVRYFKSLLDRFEGDVKLALAAYNAGSRHVRNYEGVPPFKATRIYIQKVLKFHQKFKAEMEIIARKMV